MRLSLIVALLSVSLFACTSNDDTSCGAPGGTQSCVCIDAASGVQICGDDGAWGACECAAPQDMSSSPDINVSPDMASRPDMASSPDMTMDAAPAIPGCTDGDASNFNAAASEDDGSCAYNVTFTVDVSKIAITDTDVVYVSGDFQSKLGQADWCIDCTPMTESSARVYTTTVALAPGTYAYAFHVNARAPREEVPEACGVPLGQFINRQVVISDAPVNLEQVVFSGCPCNAATCSGINTCRDGVCMNSFEGSYTPGRFTIVTERGTCTQRMGMYIDSRGGFRFYGVDPTTGEPDRGFTTVSCESGFQGSSLPMRVQVLGNGATTATPPNTFNHPIELVFTHANFTKNISGTLTGSVSNGTFTGSLTGLPQTVSIGLDNEVRSVTFIAPER